MGCPQFFFFFLEVELRLTKMNILKGVFATTDDLYCIASCSVKRYHYPIVASTMDDDYIIFI